MHRCDIQYSKGNGGIKQENGETSSRIFDVCGFFHGHFIPKAAPACDVI